MSIKKKIIDIASDVLSAPVRAYYGSKARQANSDADVLQYARKFDDAPNVHNGMPTDAFKARNVAESVRERLIKKNYKKGFNK